MEKVWWRLKPQVTANRLHCDVDRLVGAVDAFFGGVTRSAARALAACDLRRTSAHLLFAG